jgi:hypothetical protein
MAVNPTRRNVVRYAALPPYLAEPTEVAEVREVEIP